MRKFTLALCPAILLSGCAAPLPPSVPSPDTERHDSSSPAPQPITPPPRSTAENPKDDKTLVTPPVHVGAVGLGGYWTVQAPITIGVQLGLLSGVSLRYSPERYDRDICRLHHDQDRIQAACVAGSQSTAQGSLDPDDDSFVLHWWHGPATLNFTGSWPTGADVIDGALSGGMAGFRVTGKIPANLHKVWPHPVDAKAWPSAQMILKVFDDLSHKRHTAEWYDPKAAKRLQALADWTDIPLPPANLGYLGKIHIHWQPGQPDVVQDVYDVQTDTTHALCRIALNERNRVTDFSCQTLSDEAD